MARRFACLLGLERVPDYTTVFRREKRLKVPVNLRLGNAGQPVVIAIDATGWKVTNRGEWKREGRKGCVKLHIAVNVKTKEIVSMRLTDERVHDREMAEPLIREASQGVHIVKLLADGAYDSRELFNLLQELGIEPVVRVRKDSSRLARGCPARGGWCWLKNSQAGRKGLAMA
ncbi:MAG: transposase [Candidatus Bathyarchaeia archaeon]|nr:transposase [Candidatus Bathyarchaeia archaeon]